MKSWSPVKTLLPMLLLLVLVAGFAGGVQAQESAHATTAEQTTPEAQSPKANEQEKDENEAYRHSKVVQKIGTMMGMSTEAAATTFEVFNFAVLAILVGVFLVKTLPRTFRDRTSEIQKHLVDARTATEEASLRLNSVEDRLSKLDAQIAEMRAQSEKDAVLEEQRMKSVVEEEKARILAAADQEIASASALAQRSLQRYAAELAIEQAARKLVVSAETDRLLVQGFARRLANDETGGQN